MTHTSQTHLSEIPELRSHLKLKRDDTYVRKQTTVRANKIILEMPDTSFLEDERIAGTIMLDLRTKVNAKRLTIQIIGELNQISRKPIKPASQKLQKKMTMNEVLTSYKKSTTLAKTKRQQTKVYPQRIYVNGSSPNGATSSFNEQRPLRASADMSADGVLSVKSTAITQGNAVSALGKSVHDETSLKDIQNLRPSNHHPAKYENSTTHTTSHAGYY